MLCFVILIGCSQNTATETIRDEIIIDVGVAVEVIENTSQLNEPLNNQDYELIQIIIDKYNLMSESNDLNKSEKDMLTNMMGLANRYSEYVDTNKQKHKDRYEATLKEIKNKLNEL